MSRRMIDEKELNGVLEGKQEKLKAGKNITISEDNTISSKGGAMRIAPTVQDITIHVKAKNYQVGDNTNFYYSQPVSDAVSVAVTSSQKLVYAIGTAVFIAIPNFDLSHIGYTLHCIKAGTVDTETSVTITITYIRMYE